MSTFRGIFGLFLVLLATTAILLPLTVIAVPLPNEAWLMQSIRELHQHLSLVPTLNGLEISDKNPLTILLYSLMPSDNIVLLRLLNLICGGLLVTAVFIFSTTTFTAGIGVTAAILTATSTGFMVLFGTLNHQAIPTTLVLLAYLLFVHAYLKNAHGWHYSAAYLLLGFAAVSGGWITIAFMALAITALLLLDFAPANILRIRIISGILLIAFMLVVFYLIYRIAGGQNYVSAALSHPTEDSLLKTLWTFIKATMPWLLLVIPAWIYETGPEKEEHWRDLLPVKIGFVAAFVIMLLTTRHAAAHAILAVPFAAIMTAYWMHSGFNVPPKLLKLRHAAIVLSGAIAIATAFALTAKGPISEITITTAEIIILGGFLTAAVAFILLVRKQHYRASIKVVLFTILIGSWVYAFLAVPHQTKGSLDYIRQIAQNAPIVTFEDDLIMRGLLGYADARPIIVSREIVPIGAAAYLATVTKDPDGLNERLNQRMLAQIESSFGKGPTYVLYFIETETLQ